MDNASPVPAILAAIALAIGVAIWASPSATRGRLAIIAGAAGLALSVAVWIAAAGGAFSVTIFQYATDSTVLRGSLGIEGSAAALGVLLWLVLLAVIVSASGEPYFRGQRAVLSASPLVGGTLSVLVFSGDLATAWMAWEILGLLLLMVTLASTVAAQSRAAVRCWIAGEVAGLFCLLVLMLALASDGVATLGSVATWLQVPSVDLGAWPALLAFALLIIKAGVFPTHTLLGSTLSRATGTCGALVLCVVPASLWVLIRLLGPGSAVGGPYSALGIAFGAIGVVLCASLAFSGTRLDRMAGYLVGFNVAFVAIGLGLGTSLGVASALAAAVALLLSGPLLALTAKMLRADGSEVTEAEGKALAGRSSGVVALLACAGLGPTVVLGPRLLLTQASVDAGGVGGSIGVVATILGTLVITRGVLLVLASLPGNTANGTEYQTTHMSLAAIALSILALLPGVLWPWFADGLLSALVATILPGRVLHLLPSGGPVLVAILAMAIGWAGGLAWFVREARARGLMAKPRADRGVMESGEPTGSFDRAASRWVTLEEAGWLDVSRWVAIAGYGVARSANWFVTNVFGRAVGW